MARQNAISEYRNVKIAFDNASGAIDGSELGQIAAPLDAFKAAIEVVTRLEGEYAKLGAVGVPDVIAKAVLATGAIPFQIHSFTVTTVMETGTYTFLYIETKPNVSETDAISEQGVN